MIEWRKCAQEKHTSFEQILECMQSLDHSPDEESHIDANALLMEALAILAKRTKQVKVVAAILAEYDSIGKWYA